MRLRPGATWAGRDRSPRLESESFETRKHVHEQGFLAAEQMRTAGDVEDQPIGRIQLPERCANLCFGGLKRNRLFMCGSTSMFSVYVNTQGVAGG